MANQEHLAILKQGVEKWNRWKMKNPSILPDLTDANLSYADLRGANLREANLGSANLYSVDLDGADLSNANLSGVDLGSASLSDTKLNNANLSGADLRFATLVDSSLDGANLRGSDLRGAGLNNAILWRVSLTSAHLQKTDFTNARIRDSMFVNMDLSVARGLDSVRHDGPSHISIDTLYKSGGNIPESFLRGCGAPDDFIAFARALIGKAIEFYSCFISYSSKNSDIAERLYADLQSKGVRCWFAPEDIKIGDKFRQRIDEAIRIHDKLLVILSEDSISSAWVEEEVESAIEREHREKRLVLFPIRIDEAVINSDQAWAASLRRMRHIGDFSKWKDHDSYTKAFERLLRDLKSESKS